MEFFVRKYNCFHLYTDAKLPFTPPNHWIKEYVMQNKRGKR